ncbi:UbiA family prenyltransferase [Streptomyces peucetius]|nr:prenyltransferase [Streptomyces peucetius subsp. caesius ATCC 27952]
MTRALPVRLAPPAPGPSARRSGRIPAGPADAAEAAPGTRRSRRWARLGDWAELLRVSALFTVPGDALAGAAAAGLRPNRGTAYAIGASLCLYEAGMALNDWSDREEDAVDRPHRPIPSGRITPRAALTAAGALTATGLVLAARAGRPALAVATALSATVWAYDLRLKHTPAAPATMAAARGLDLLLGATATLSAAATPSGATPQRPAGPSRGTFARSPRRVASADRPGAGPSGSRRGFGKGWGGGLGAPAGVGRTADPVPPGGGRRAAGAAPPPGAPGAVRPAPAGAWAGASARLLRRGAAAAFPPGAALPAAAARSPRRVAAADRPGAGPSGPRRGFGKGRGGGLRTAARAAAALAAHTYAVTAVSRHEAHGGSTVTPLAALAATATLGAAVAWPPSGPAPVLLAAAYLRTAATPYLHAALNPSPPLTQRAVGGGIRAMIPLQAALAARSGAGVTGAAVMGLVPLARKLARKVSPT